MTVSTTVTENLLRRERWLVIGALLLVSLACALYVLDGAGTGMNARAMSHWGVPGADSTPVDPGPWSPGYWLLMLGMWWLMMIAMMLPSAAPMVLLYARVYRHNQQQLASPLVPTAAFLAGYLVLWLWFSLVATALQWGLEQTGLLHAFMMWSTSKLLSGALLVAAGSYQFSALKQRCLQLCRSPASFISQHWQTGTAGAWSMGLRHGLYCLGCCWALMSLLFVGGIMNLVWIAGLAILVLVEKLGPAGDWTRRAIGVLLFGAGAWLCLEWALLDPGHDR